MISLLFCGKLVISGIVENGEWIIPGFFTDTLSMILDMTKFAIPIIPIPVYIFGSGTFKNLKSESMTDEDFRKMGWNWCKNCKRWYWFPRSGPHNHCFHKNEEKEDD